MNWIAVSSTAAGAIIAGLVVWLVRSWTSKRDKEERSLIEQGYINKQITESIDNLKTDFKELSIWKENLIDERNDTKQKIFDGISDLKNDMAFLRKDLEQLTKDHEKRIETLEKKLLI